MRRLRSLLTAGALLAVLPIIAVAQDQPPTDAAPPAAPPNVAVEPSAFDVEIESRIADILEATGWFERVKVEVRDGVVFLDGVTNSDERHAWAGELASRTQDVAAVVNRIEIDRPVAWTFEPAFREIEESGRDLVAALPLIILAIVVLPLAWTLARLVGRLARRLLSGRMESELQRDVASWAVAAPIFLIGLYVVLQAAGLTGLAVSVLGGAGVIGIVFGFAFRDIAENFLASLLLSIRRPYRPGDFIHVAEQTGFVRSMNVRSTILLSPEGNHIQIPNATVFKSIITNYSTAPARRQTLEVGIGYDAPVPDAQAIVVGVLERHPAVMADPEPLVLVDALASSTVNLRIHYWYDGSAYSGVKVKSAVLRLVKKALTEAGVSMPDDAREVLFPEGVPILERAGDAPPPTPAPPAAPESADAATEAEGDLANEREEVEANAAASATEDMAGDLLTRRDDKPPTG